MTEVERLKTEVQYLEGFLKVYLGGLAKPSQEKEMARDVERAIKDLRGNHTNVKPPIRVHSVMKSTTSIFNARGLHKH